MAIIDGIRTSLMSNTFKGTARVARDGGRHSAMGTFGRGGERGVDDEAMALACASSRLFWPRGPLKKTRPPQDLGDKLVNGEWG